ncbi:MAG: oligosaccharide flippase family protein [Eubacteriales bacterium]|nr:oligosaccharide flippase family protein [Eubacteriales bacterium]
MSREGKLAKNTMIIAIGTFLPKLASFVTLPILTGCLTKEEYGAYDLIAVLVSLLLPAATLQIQAAAFRFLIDERENDESIKTIITNIVCFIIPTSLIALVIMFFILTGQNMLIRVFICLYFLADIVVNAARQVCRGLNRNMDYSMSAVLSAAGKVIFTVICVLWLRAGLLGTVISLFAASTFSLLYLLVKVRLLRYFDLRCFRADKLREMLRYSWPMVPNSMSAWVMRVSDRLVVTAFMGISANAVYAVANKIPSLLNLAQNTFTMAWQENASIVSKDSDASEYYSSMFRTMFDLQAGFFGVLIAATPLLFRLLIRGDYAEAYFQIPILFVAMFFFSMSTFLGGIYVAYKRSRSVGVTTTIAAAINLVTDLASIRWIGLYAASGSTLISYIFLFLFRIRDVQKIVRVRYDLRHVLLVLGVMTLESVLCFRQRMLFNVLNILIGVALFFVLNRGFLRAVLRKLAGMRRR